MIDKTAPDIAGVRSPQANAAGWNNTPVTVDFTCADHGSGIAACGDTPQLIATEGLAQSRSAVAVDLAGNQATAVIAGINIDMTPPSAMCVATPAVLWPPNHALVDVSVGVQVTDALSGPGHFVLDSALSSEPDDAPGRGDGATTGDVQAFVADSPDTSGQLRAERAAEGLGRFYTLTYRVSDRAANGSVCAAIIAVPHDGQR